jgi:hypothetical protein
VIGFIQDDTALNPCDGFEFLQAFRQMSADWLRRCNHRRPHESFGRIPPVEFRAVVRRKAASSLQPIPPYPT